MDGPMTVTEESYRMWHWVGSGATDDALHVQSVVWRGPKTILYSSNCEKIELTRRPKLNTPPPH